MRRAIRGPLSPRWFSHLDRTPEEGSRIATIGGHAEASIPHPEGLVDRLELPIGWLVEDLEV
jgi:hypothetical protein